MRMGALDWLHDFTMYVLSSLLCACWALCHEPISVLINVCVYIYTYIFTYIIYVYMLIWWPLQIFNPSPGPGNIKWGSWSVNWRQINLFSSNNFSFVKSQQTVLRKQERKSYPNTKTGSLTNHCYNNTVIYGVEKNLLVRFFVHLKRKILGNHEPHYAPIKNQFDQFSSKCRLEYNSFRFIVCALWKVEYWNFDLI